MNRSKKLQIQQLEHEIADYRTIRASPKGGWIRTIRTALNMTLLQMGKAMGIASPNVLDMEKREVDGTITLNTLRKAAGALNMRVVYGFLPVDGTFEKMLEKRALIVARRIVLKTNATMKLEDQNVSKDRIEKSIKELADEIKNEIPKYLWD